MRHRHIAGEHLKASQFNLIHVAHGSIGDHAQASHRQKDVRVNFADKGSQASGFVHIFDDHNAWSWNTQDVVPPFAAFIVVALAYHRRVGATHASGGGITNQWQTILEDAA